MSNKEIVMAAMVVALILALPAHAESAEMTLSHHAAVWNEPVRVTINGEGCGMRNRHPSGSRAAFRAPGR